MLSGITNYKDDNCTLIQSFRNSYCSGEIRASGTAAEYPFHSSQVSRQFKRISISNIDHFVNIFNMNVGWHNLLADSFDQIRSCFNEFSRLLVGLEDRAIRICTDYAYAWILLF